MRAGVHRETVARGQLGVDGSRVDARVAKLLLDLAQRDALPHLINGRAVPKVPPGGGSHCTVAANHLDQGNHVRWIEWVSDDAPLWVLTRGLHHTHGQAG